MALGRPSYLQESQTNVPMLTLGDFLGSSQDNIAQQSVGPQCFVAMAELSLILSDILCSFYTLHAVLRLRNAETQHILDIAQDIEVRLATWQSTFLDPLMKNKHFPDVTGEPSQTEVPVLALIISAGPIELAYLTVQIMLLRATCPKLVQRTFPLSTYLDNAISISLKVVYLVETLQISRLSAFWWFRKSPFSEVSSNSHPNQKKKPPDSIWLLPGPS